MPAMGAALSAARIPEVDRSASCAAEHCQNLVAAGVAEKLKWACYVIGMSEPTSVMVNAPEPAFFG